jgi:hypothetical protein
MLIEAKGQVAYGGWGRWLKKNFELSDDTARRYMRWARQQDEKPSGARETPYTSMRQMTGHTGRKNHLCCDNANARHRRAFDRADWRKI